VFDGNEQYVLTKYALPTSATDGQGVRYDPREDLWLVPGMKRNFINLERYRRDCTPLFLQSLKLTLIEKLKTLSQDTVSCYLVKGLDPLLNQMVLPCKEITRTDLEAYWFALPAGRKYAFSSIRSLNRTLGKQGIPGHSITPDALAFLETLKTGDNPNGVAASSWDPVNGPMTPDELHAFISALNAAFARFEISAEKYFLILLFASFGARTANLADLKVCDLQQKSGIDGVPAYTLRIPRVKQRGGRFRQTFYERSVVQELGVLLQGYIADLMERHADLGLGDQLPMFVDPGNNSDPIRTFHRSTGYLAKKAEAVTQKLAVPCARTGEALHGNPRRFRYTQATLARAMGFSPSQIAALLDHGTTRTQEIYAAISPEVLRGIMDRLHGFRGPLAGAFLGRLGAPGEVADPQHLIFRPKFRADVPEPTLGGCEASRRCGGRRPFACYLCPLFYASMEGDHEGALLDVLEERVKFDRYAGDALRYLTANAVADAIREVIRMVEERLEEMGKTLAQIRAEKEALLRKQGLIS